MVAGEFKVSEIEGFDGKGFSTLIILGILVALFIFGSNDIQKLSETPTNVDEI